MSAENIIIDVEPVAYSSERSSAAGVGYRPGNHYEQTQAGSRSAYPGARNAYAGYETRYGSQGSYGGQRTAVKSADSLFTGLAQMAMGIGLALVGIPMLILPGPGLLAICCGVALASSGYRKVFA